MISALAGFASCRIFSWCLFFTTLVLGAGCGFGDFCEVGNSRCNGNVLEVCVPGGDDAPGGSTGGLGPFWNPTTCAVSCETLSGEWASCVDAGSPVDAAVDFASPFDVCGDGGC